MDKGEIKEIGEPMKLKSDPKSYYSRVVEETLKEYLT